jgi:hypothetical protein
MPWHTSILVLLIGGTLSFGQTPVPLAPPCSGSNGPPCVVFDSPDKVPYMVWPNDARSPRQSTWTPPPTPTYTPSPLSPREDPLNNGTVIPPPPDGSGFMVTTQPPAQSVPAPGPSAQTQNLQNQIRLQNQQRQQAYQAGYQAGQQIGDAIGQAIYNHRMAEKLKQQQQQLIAAEIAAEKVRQGLATIEHFGLTFSEEFANTITSPEDCTHNGFFVWDQSAEACHRPDHVPTPDREDVSGESFYASVDPDGALAAKGEVQRKLVSECSGQLVNVIYGSQWGPIDTDGWRDVKVYATAQCIKAQ